MFKVNNKDTSNLGHFPAHKRKSLFLAFLPLEDSYIVHNHIDTSFLFLLQKDFYIAHKNNDDFCLFLL